jgi:hypothetical protein
MAQDQEIVASYRWTAEEMYVAKEIFWDSRWRPLYRRIFYILCSFMVIASIGIVAQEGLAFSPIVMFFAGTYALFLRKHFAWWLTRRHFKTRPDRDLQETWTITQDLLRIHTAHSDSTCDWSVLYKIRKSDRGFLLFPNSAVFHWLPAHAFSSEQDRNGAETIMREKVQDFAVVR